MLQLLVGLGNPGPEYDGTRHNAGFGWLDELGRQTGARFNTERRFKGRVACIDVDGHRVLLLKPLTFMNLSGESVAALAGFYKVKPEEILVVHDELDLPPGHVKVKQGGGHAGHNGLRDIQARLGSAQFWRLRIGIGHPGGRQQVLGWVLGRASADDRAAIASAVDRSLRELPDLVAGRFDRATQAIHAGNPPPVNPGAGAGAAVAARR